MLGGAGVLGPRGHMCYWFQGEMLATPECFAHLTQLLQVLAGGRVCAVLEVRMVGRASAGSSWEDPCQ